MYEQQSEPRIVVHTRTPIYLLYDYLKQETHAFMTFGRLRLCCSDTEVLPIAKEDVGLPGVLPFQRQSRILSGS